MHKCAVPDSILEAAKRRFAPFWEQCDAVSDYLIENAPRLSIGVIVLYGSMVKGPRPGSDIDILILLSEDFRDWGINLLDMQDAIEECAEEAKINDVPLDLHIRSCKSFVDVSHGTAFKRSVSEDNIILWEDGVTLDRKFIKDFKGFQ